MSVAPAWMQARTAERTGARPCVVELLGPAGSGKSTLRESLLADRARYGGALTVWGLPRRHLASGAVTVAPVAAAAALAGQPLGRRELAQMIRLEALRDAADEVCDRGVSDGVERLVLMDEGPLFGLAWLDVLFGRRDAGFTRWRRQALQDWGARLVAVVRLDAADAVLACRIRARAQAHPVKGHSDAEIERFTDRFRRAFDRVLAELDAEAPVRVVHLRTDDTPGAQAATRVHRMLEEARHAR